ncbi:D-alanyl-D-alanine carboxypeptidase family protein [Croceibacterium aestuarii]|uniref:D-alanyl-D-alanine carboxypeptidase family protein n=1 Tax=Croceibacterium aestuarii TaxID=3064139 RepID=UPI00272EB547|nr:D-alanyl-D-alanine carboxypeptidase family protein [Croceibacterium sp. D39]
MKHFIATILGTALLATTAYSAPPETLESGRQAEGESPVDPEIPVALLVDQSAGQTLFSREPDRRFVPASVTKIMTVYTAFDLIDRGKLSLDRKVVIDKDLADEWGGEGSTLFLETGDELTIGQLLLGVTTVSANDGAVAVGRAAAGSDSGWLALMNENARKLGMRNSHFGSPNGYPDEGRTWTSARDLAILAEALTTRFPKLYKRFIGHKQLRFHEITQNNHDPITGVVPGADGIKTGYTRQAGYNFVGSAVRGGRRLTLVLAGAPTAPIRNRAARRLMEWGFDNFTSERLLPAGAAIGEVEVQDGSVLAVPVRTEAEVFANLPRSPGSRAGFSLRYTGPVEAPIKQGERIATLRVTVPGQEPHDVPLVAAEAVDPANAWQRLRNGVAGLF